MRREAPAALALVLGCVEPTARRPLRAGVERSRDLLELLERQRRMLWRAQPVLLQFTSIHLLQAHEALPRVAVECVHVILALLQFVLGETLAQTYAHLWTRLVGV